MIAEFVQRYPGEWQGGHIRWPWFRYLLKYMPNVAAMRSLEAIRTAAAGMASSEAISQVVRDLTEEVYKVR